MFKKIVAALPLLVLITLLIQPVLAAPNSSTTRFVQTCVKAHIKSKYHGKVEMVSPVGETTYNGGPAWICKSIFTALGQRMFGEFVVKNMGTGPSSLRVIHEDVRPH